MKRRGKRESFKKLFAFFVMFILVFSVMFSSVGLVIAQDEEGGDEGGGESEPESNPEPEPEPEIEEPEDEIEEQEPEVEEEEFEEDFEPEYFGDVEICEGCNVQETESGIVELEVEDFDPSDFEEFAIEDEMNECEGRFEMIEGKPTCIVQGNAGFGTTECPNQEEIDSLKSGCDGEIKEFEDEGGCSAVMCIDEEFDENFDNKIEEIYGDDPLKAQALICKKDGGEFVLIKDKPHCIMEGSEIITVGKDLKEISGEDIKRVAGRLEQMEDGISKIKKKLSNFEGEVFEEAIEKLEGIEDKIKDIKVDLATGDLTDEERRAILKSAESLKSSISRIIKGLIKGKMPKKDELYEEKFEQYKEFYGGPFESKEELEEWAEKEKSALEKVRNCDKYESIESFVPPDPEGMVVQVDLLSINGNCKITMHFAEGGTAEYDVPNGVSSTFRGPEDLIKQGIPCSGNCDKMEKLMTMSHGPGEDPEGEACMEECIVRDCDEGTFSCMSKNLEKCEDECGMKKGPDMGDMGAEERCIIECVSKVDPSIVCGAGTEAGAGEQGGEVCQRCAQECEGLYEGPCMTEEVWRQKEEECMSQGEHMEAVPVMGDSGQGYECEVDIKCVDRSSEFGDEPGYGPPGGMSGYAVVEDSGDGFFSKLVSWFKSLFGGKKDLKKESIEGGSEDIDELETDVDDVVSDLTKISNELEGINGDIG